MSLSHNTAPHHVAVILDGNGRWAEKKGLPASKGHKEGLERAREFIQYALKAGIRHATLFVFGKDNWKRPKSEILGIFSLFEQAFSRLLENEIHSDGVRLRFIGDIQSLPKSLKRLIGKEDGFLKGEERMTLWIAINYSGQWDLSEAAKSLVQNPPNPHQIEDYSALLESRLPSKELPPVDLLIRTSGESRLSNFLLWQTVYSELYFCTTLWPDFSELDFQNALDFWKGRERRYGARIQKKECS